MAGNCWGTDTKRHPLRLGGGAKRLFPKTNDSYGAECGSGKEEGQKEHESLVPKTQAHSPCLRHRLNQMTQNPSTSTANPGKSKSDLPLGRGPGCGEGTCPGYRHAGRLKPERARRAEH